MIGEYTQAMHFSDFTYAWFMVIHNSYVYINYIVMQIQRAN